MLKSLRNILLRIRNRIFGKTSNGLKGELIKKKDGNITFFREERYFNVQDVDGRAKYENYDDWKLIQTLKGRDGAFPELWEKTKEKQIKNWNFIEIKENEKMLEVGFRDGYNLKYLKSLGIEIEGIEVNTIAIKAAEELGCKVFEEDIQKKTHFEDKTFDVISACDVLEHCYEPEDALREMYRILKDDGRIVIEIPLEKKFGRNLMHGHSALFYNEKQFEKLVNSIGFYVFKKDIKSYAQSLFILKKISNKAKD